MAYHVIFGAYGFWMPNDRRGSYSRFVGAWDLFRFGGRSTFGADPREGLSTDDARAGERALLRGNLKYPPVLFTGEQALAAESGFGDFAKSKGLRIAACAVMPDHVHLVTMRHTMASEQVVIRLKASATRSLVESGIHPMSEYREEGGRLPKCFARGEWKSFLNTEQEIQLAVNYVRQNPIREGLRAQNWSFVLPVV